MKLWKWPAGLPGKIILASWLIYVVYWGVSSIGVKKSAKGSAGARVVLIRLILVLLILILIERPGFRADLGNLKGLVAAFVNPIVEWMGVILCALGIGLACWARKHLGTNWGQPMSVKEDPELIITGPYAYIRHPIYAGLLLAFLGSALGWSLIWLVLFAFFFPYFLYSTGVEEKIMLHKFPELYPGYMRRTKRMIPGVY